MTGVPADAGTGPCGDAVPADDDAGRHRALASPRRAAILRVLRGHDGPLPVEDVAAAVGVHVNTAREHLERLWRAGLVVRTREERTVRGRPRWLWAPQERTAAADDAGPPRPAPGGGARGGRARAGRGHGDAGPDAGDDAGERWLRDRLDRVLLAGYGRPLDAPAETAEREARAAVPAPTARGVERTAGAQVEALCAHFRRLGFDPDASCVDDPGAPLLLLRRCPLLDLARERADVVCAVHLGLARGVLDGVGGPLTATSLEPFGQAGACVLRLAPAPSAPAAEALPGC